MYRISDRIIDETGQVLNALLIEIDIAFQMPKPISDMVLGKNLKLIFLMVNLAKASNTMDRILTRIKANSPNSHETILTLIKAYNKINEEDLVKEMQGEVVNTDLANSILDQFRSK